MRKTIGKYSILCFCFLLISGCASKKSSSQLVDDLYNPVTQIVKSEIENPETISNEEMKRFFAQYLTIDEETILTLNQKPKIIDSDYWEAYGVYKSKTNQILGDYLSSSAKSKLNKHYIQDDFHYLRLLEINDYVIIGILSVEDAIITAKHTQNNNDVYAVMVTATANAIDIKEANKRYEWDKNMGYYVKNISADSEGETELGSDSIKVILNYWVETSPSKTLEINSVKERTGISLGIDEQTSSKNNSFLSRISYFDQVRDKDGEKINLFLDSFMKQEYNFYNYYRKAYNTSYDILKLVLESDLGLMNVVQLNEEDYRSQFSPLIIPLKDNMDFLSFNIEEDVGITPHISSSEKHPAYEVSIQADVILINGNQVFYEYIYLFIFEDDMISTVRLISQNKGISQEEEDSDLE